MNSEKIHIENQSLGKIIYLKLKDIMLLTKFRLSSLVVFSAVMSYLIAVHSIHIDGIKIILLALGGFLGEDVTLERLATLDATAGADLEALFGAALGLHFGH